MGIITMIKALKIGWKTWLSLILGVGVIALLYFGFMATWKRVAFANPEVKEMVIQRDTLAAANQIQYMQLQTFEQEVEYWNLKYNSALDSIANLTLNYENREQQHQRNNKLLINRAKAASASSVQVQANMDSLVSDIESNGNYWCFSPLKRSDFRKVEKWEKYRCNPKTKERL